MVGMLFEVVDERLPRVHPSGSYNSKHVSSIHWEKHNHRDYSPDQLQALIFQTVGEFIAWPLVLYEYPALDDTHQYNIHRSADYTREVFLESNVYQAWRTRKIRGPGLLCATGSGVSTFL